MAMMGRVESWESSCAVMGAEAAGCQGAGLAVAVPEMWAAAGTVAGLVGEGGAPAPQMRPQSP